MERKKYIDIAKGVLIMLVVIGHIDLMFIGWNPMQNNNYYFHVLHDYMFLYSSFYMPAFFLISGMCSNFGKKIGTGIIGDIKTLFIPAMIAELLFDFLGHNFKIWHHIEHFVLYGAGGWFIASLFLCKTVLRFIVKYCNDKIIIAFSLIAPCLAFLTYRSNDAIWSYTQTLDMFPFLAVGYLLRNLDVNKLITLFSITIYGLVLMSLKIFDLEIPVVTHSYNISNLYQVFVHLVLAVSGSFGFLGLCKIIESSAIFEYFGKSSMIVYLYHLWFLQMFVPKINEIVIQDNDIFLSCVLYFGIFFITMVFCLCLVCLFNNKYMYWSLGKKWNPF